METHATQPTLQNGLTSTTTVRYVDSVPSQRERACLNLLWIHESVQYSVKHLAVSAVSLLQVHKDVRALWG